MKRKNNRTWTAYEHLAELPAKTRVYLHCPHAELRRAQFTAGFSLEKTEFYSFGTTIIKAQTAAEFFDIVLFEGIGMEQD